MSNADTGLKIKQFVPKDAKAGKGDKTLVKRTRSRVPDDQRKRARQACESCRQRKEKCYGGMPCTRCARVNTVCTLATDIGGTSEQSPHAPLSTAERTVFLERVLKNILGITRLPDAELRAMEEALPRTDGNSKGSVDDERTRFEDGTESSLLTFSRQLQQKLGDSITEEEADYTNEEVRHSRTSTSGDGNGLVNSTRARLPGRGIAEALIGICFTYVQCNSFFVSVQWINATLDACYAHPSSLSNENLPNITTLAMIMALGTQFANMSPYSSTLSHDNMGCSLEELGNGLYELATGLLSELIKRPTFESMRSCLLIATYLFPVDLPRLAYTYLGLALHMATRIGMHKRSWYSGHSHPSQFVREEHIRVWWTLYTFYQRARIFHGHPRTLSHAEIDVDRPRPVSELEPSNGVSNFRNQVALIDVTLILEDVAGEIALLRKARKGVHVANLLALRRKLVGLLDELPVLDPQEQLEADIYRLRLDIHVYLHYWHTRLFLGRPFLLSHPKQTFIGQADAPSPSLNVTPGRELLAHDSVDAAVRIVHLCQIIHDRIGLAGASYATEFTSCRAAMLVLVARSITEKSEEVASALAQGLILIQQMSIGHGQASSETRVIVALQRAITRLHQDAVREAQHLREADRGAPYDDHVQQWAKLWQQSSVSPHDGSAFVGITEDSSSSLPPRANVPHQSVFMGADEFPDFSVLGLDYDTGDWWTTVFNSHLDEFTMIPEMDNM